MARHSLRLTGQIALAVRITELISGEQHVAAIAVLADAMLHNPLPVQAFGAT